MDATPDANLLPALYRLAALASRGDDPRVALREMLDIFVETFRADAGSIALLSPDTSHLETEVHTGLATGMAYSDIKLGHGITGWCVLNHRSLLAPDVSHEPRYIAVRPSCRCEMAAPMIDGDNVIGVIDLESDFLSGFTSHDLAQLEILAAESARVMQRLWTLRHLRAKARQLESLVTVGQSLVTKFEQQDLLDSLTHEARHMMQARAAGLYLHDASTDTIHCASLTSNAVIPLPRGDQALNSCLVGASIHTQRQVAFLDVQSPEFHDLTDIPKDPSLRSVLVSPLLFEGEVLAVLAVFTDCPHRFDNDEKRLCAALAGLGAVALQNARLYARIFKREDVLRKNERLTTLGLLAAEIAHEIRNPLTVLKLLHGGLDLDFPAGDPRRTDMRVIGEKLDQLESIVTRVLGFAKTPTSLHSRWSLSDIVDDTLVLVRLKLAQSKVSLVFDPPKGQLFVEAQKGQIQQVLLNLLINATQAMPDGGTITLTATVGGPTGGHLAMLDIADTGTGIPESIRNRVFDSFLSGRADGTGLGLAIAKRILLSHHGDIALVSTSSSGTTMRLVLPLAK